MLDFNPGWLIANGAGGICQGLKVWSSDGKDDKTLASIPLGRMGR